MKRSIILGTRGSPLAVAQTELVADSLRKKNRGNLVKFEIKTIKTSGDDLFRKPNKKLTGKDAFTGAIDSALVRGEIDVAIHSLKDVPSESFQRKKIEIVAFPKRDSPFDVMISRQKGNRLRALPHGAKIGTSSVRRSLQLKTFRPDLQVVEIHGNVHTRIRKLRENNSELDAIILAEAGLNRLGLQEEIDEVLPKEVMLPAVGQGCLAVSVRCDDAETRALISKIDHKETRQATTAERAFSFELGGGCNLPIAALAMIDRRSKTKARKITLHSLVTGEKGDANLVIRDEIRGPLDEAESLGKNLAKKMKSLI